MTWLCIFDCDGTLVDSQHTIVAAMTSAFAGRGLPPPPAAAVKRIVGLTLKDAVEALLPDAQSAVVDDLAEGYRTACGALRRSGAEAEPLFPDVVSVLDVIERSGWLLAMATGKSHRGAMATLSTHRLTERFVSIQSADSAAGKPAPDMILRAMAEVGAAPETTVMLGDTAFDMLMAQNAGVVGLGAAWGYHDEDELWAAGAHAVLRGMRELPALLAAMVADAGFVRPGRDDRPGGAGTFSG
jgi:phosphoglycolate phosphatase